MVCCVCVPGYSVVFDSVMPQTVGRHAPLFMEFPRQEYWSGLSFPTPRHLPNPGIKPASLASHWQADSLLPHQLGMKAHPRSYLQKNLHCSPMSGRVAFLLAGGRWKSPTSEGLSPVSRVQIHRQQAILPAPLWTTLQLEALAPPMVLEGLPDCLSRARGSHTWRCQRSRPSVWKD